MQVLVSAMNIRDINEFIRKMNLKTDAIIINQSDNIGYKMIKKNQCKIEIFSFNERGVGLSRNSALMRAKSDIVLIADEDVTYNDGYEKIILDAFNENKKADMILFNLESRNNDRPLYKISKKRRINRFNSMKYGAVRIALKLDKIRSANISFSLLFGGGAKYGSGEDSLFIRDCLKKGLKIYTCPKSIGKVEQGHSTWFQGYNEKFFIDKGALYYCMSPKFALLLAIQFIIRHRKTICYDISMRDAIRYMNKGIKEMKGEK